MKFGCLALFSCFFINFSSVSSQTDSSLACFCLPANQICDPNTVTPRNAIQIENVDTRILNQNPEALCQQGRNPCCFSAPGGGTSTGPTGPVGRISDCGTFQSLLKRQLPGQADFGEYPWMALLTDHNHQFVATGALVSPRHVITVAHKIPAGGARSLVVRLGDYDISTENDLPGFPHVSVGVNRIIVHPQFDRERVTNNIAILELSRPVEYRSHIRSICLPAQGQIFDGQTCFVSGWGKRGPNGNFQPVLKEVDLPIVDTLQCESLLRTTALSRHFILDKKSFVCAGGIVGKDACEGDGGAPLVCQQNNGNAVAVGLVAWGVSCGTNVPGVYVNLPNYANWIQSQIGLF